MTMSRSEARQWLSRWKEVEERSSSELRRLSLEEKFAQLSSLMKSSTLFPTVETFSDEDLRVAERWMLLRKRLGCDHQP